MISDNKLIKIDVPKIPSTFTGSGDLFAALFLAHTYLQDDMKIAIEKTVNSLYNILLKTYEYSQGIYSYYLSLSIDKNIYLYIEVNNNFQNFYH